MVIKMKDETVGVTIEVFVRLKLNVLFVFGRW